MRTLFFVIVAVLSIIWLYISFHFFKLDNSQMIYSKAYDNIFFEAIFFVWLFVFGFYLWRFFCFWSGKKNIKNIKKENNREKKDEKFLIKKEKTDKQEELNNEDNLKIIEWIWPKVEELLKLNWIKTLQKLSESSYDELKMILERAWDNFKIINPRTWPYQAELATKKQWGKLKEYQDFLVWWVDPKEFSK